MIDNSRKLVLLAFLALSLGAGAQTAVKLEFQRTGTDAASTTVNVTDENGAAIEGVQATLTSNQTFKGTGGNVTPAILCPNVNGNASPDIQLTFTITGLPATFSYNTVGLDIHALNGSGTYQQNSDGKQRQWNVAVEQGAEASALSALASFNDIDIAAGVGASGDVHKMWSQTAAEASQATDPLIISLGISKGSANVGCFFGLSSLVLSTGEYVEPEQPVEDGPLLQPGAESRVYNIVWKSNTTSYMAEQLGGKVTVVSYDVTQRMFWEVIPTDVEHVYYVRNTATGRYMGSCNMTPGSASRVTTSAEPIPYYIHRTAGTGAEIAGCHWMSSTDCEGYADEESGPRALNKDGASSYVITWQAGTSRAGSYWKFYETTDLYEPRVPAGHSAYAKSAQIYHVPCTATGSNYVRSLTAGPLQYQAEAQPANAYTLYVASKGEATLDGALELQLSYDAALQTGVKAWACFDWDRDGEFETLHELPATETASLSVPVPEDAKEGRTRMRIRLDESGAENPDYDAIGQVVDFILNVKRAGMPDAIAQPEAVVRHCVAVNDRVITVTGSTPVRELRLYAMDGTLAARAHASRLGVRHLAAGTYVLSVNDEGETTKIVLK